jgi:hypothetical protein
LRIPVTANRARSRRSCANRGCDSAHQTSAFSRRTASSGDGS